MEAISRYGVFRGGFLAFKRILRCNPFCKSGYDPVPEKGLRYKGSREIPIPDECCENGSGRHGKEDVDMIAFDCEATGKAPDEASIHGKEKNL